MLNGRFITLLLVASVVAGLLPAEVLLPRRTLDRDGWSIGYSPADEPIAQRLVERLPDFEKAYAGALAAHDRDLAGFRDRAGALAVRAAAVCALPTHEAGMRRGLEQLGPALREASLVTQRTFFLRTLEIWRLEEVSRRLEAGEKLAGFTVDHHTNQVMLRMSVVWHPNRNDSPIVADFDVPPAVPLRLDDESDEDQAVEALETWFKRWIDFAKSAHSSALPMFAPLRLSDVLVSECASSAESRWIAEGIASWAWREAVLSAVPTDLTDRYVVLVAQLPVARAGRPLLRLDQWPSEQDEGPHRALACQVFCNIAERHGGADAVTRLLTEFWVLPVEQRTTASLREIYRRLFNEPLEARAPWRSLGPSLARSELSRHAEAEEPLATRASQARR